MKILEYPGRFNRELLSDQLVTTFPEWLEPAAGGGFTALYQLVGNALGVRLTVPDEADEAAILVVIQAHNPDEEPAGTALRRQILQLAQSAVGVRANDLSTAQIKALLAVVLWRHGAWTQDMRIRPLGEWN